MCTYTYVHRTSQEEKDKLFDDVQSVVTGVSEDDWW